MRAFLRYFNAATIYYKDTLPSFLSVELSDSCIDQLCIPLTMNVLGQNYVLKDMVQCVSHHFTVA